MAPYQVNTLNRKFQFHKTQFNSQTLSKEKKALIRSIEVKRTKKAYSEFEPGRKSEPDFRGELGAEDLGGAVENAELERCVVADFDSEFALSLQFDLPYSGAGHLLLLGFGIRRSSLGFQLKRVGKGLCSFFYFPGRVREVYGFYLLMCIQSKTMVYLQSFKNEKLMSFT